MVIKAFSHAVTCLVMATASSAQAGPVVAAGSSYAAVISSTTPGLSVGTVTFDGVADTFTNGGRTITVNESQQALGGGAHLISFVFSSNAVMYPTSGEAGFVNIGFGNALDLLQSVDLISGVLRMFDATGALVDSAIFADPAQTTWDGTWLAPTIAGGLLVGGRDIRRVELDINVAEIPEPHSAALVLFALLAVAGASRRKESGRMLSA